MDINRKTAFLILCDIEENDAYSNIAVNRHIDKNKPESQGFVRGLVYGVLENKILLDFILDKLVSKSINKVKIKPRTILRMGLYQVIFMNNVPEYAAINESVKLAKKFCNGQSGFINGVLRAYCRNDRSIELPDKEQDLAAYFAVKYSYHESIVTEWKNKYDSNFTENLLASGNGIPPLTIRVNTLMTNKEKLTEELESRGTLIEEGGNQYSLKIKGSEILNDELHQKGWFSVQDESSMLAVLALDPKPGDNIIDVCAAPGGKAFFAAELMQNKGRIIAWDIHEHKIKLIDQGAKRLGINIIDAVQKDGTITSEDHLGWADRVIVDGPCTGLGVVRRKPEIKYRDFNESVQFLADLQLKLLIASAPYVKKTGVLLYSTCTISELENGSVVNNFLNLFSDFRIIEEKQLFPNIDGTDGFYFCKMKRV